MKIPGVVCQKPGGSFYMTAKLPVESVEDFLMFMLTEFDDNGETAMFTPADPVSFILSKKYLKY